MGRYDVDKGLETELAGVLQKQAGGEATRSVTSAPQSPSPVTQDGKCGDGFYQARSQEELSG